MNYNPYTAPQTPGFPPGSGINGPPGAAGPAGPPQSWEVGEVLGLGWAALKKQWQVLVFAPFLAGIIGGVPNYLPALLLGAKVVRPNSAEYWGIYAGCMLVSVIVHSFLMIGQTRIYIAAARGQTPELGLLFSGGPRFLPMLAAMTLFGLSVAAGYVLLIVPGIILGLGLCLTQYYVADTDMGPIEAMKASWEATKGHKGNLFLFGLASVAVILVGLAACCIGMYAATPVVMVGMATIYLRLSGRDTPAA